MSKNIKFEPSLITQLLSKDRGANFKFRVLVSIKNDLSFKSRAMGLYKIRMKKTS